MISSEIRRYKQMVSSLNVQELLTVLNNSRLSTDERYAIELVDLYSKSLKEASYTMQKDQRVVAKYLQKARLKILKQIFK